MRFAWISLGCLLLACGQASEGPDTAPPAVARTEPADGAEGVAREPAVRVWFDEPIDCSSSHGEILHLVSGVDSLFGNVSCDKAQAMIHMTVLTPLEAGASYAAVLEPGVRDRAGNRMPQGARWSFRVSD
ncbi:MAG: Ig-like domain-containing protein [Deltaproteobacteria bacterium]|nr:Ig-like domain-containing protein [Deltaproteobacteria bacterium]